MNRQIYDRKNQQKTSSANAVDWGIPQVRPFITQLKMRPHKPDLKTSLSQAETYGHHLDKIQLASVSSSTPIQMLSAKDEEDKRISVLDLGVNKLTDNKKVLEPILNIEKRLKKLNNNHKKDSTGKIISPTETSTSKSKNKDKDKEKKSNEELTSPTTHQVSENKATEENSSTKDPEVTRLLNKASKNNLSGLNKVTQEENIAPSTYDENKNTAPPKAGTRSQLLTKKAAMNLLENNQGFTTTQRAVKKPVVDNTKAKDNQHQVKLKNAAELVRKQVIKDDRQVKEHLRGNFNLDPEIVAKEGGEELILQKVH